MTDHCIDRPTGLRAPVLDDLPAPKDTDELVAEALELAALHIVTQAGGSVSEQAIDWGSPRAFPTCCDTIAVGIMNRGGPLTDQNGQSWTPRETWWEVLISQPRPRIQKKPGTSNDVEAPLSGFGQPSPSITSRTGHAYLMSRINTLTHEHLCRIAGMYLPTDCVACQCLQIVAVVDERDACDQIRFTVQAVTK